MHEASVIPEGKRQLERTGCSLDGNTKMKLQGIGWDSMDWITLAGERNKQHTAVSMVMDLRVT